jgi:hypothetical protein
VAAIVRGLVKLRKDLLFEPTTEDPDSIIDMNEPADWVSRLVLNRGKTILIVIENEPQGYRFEILVPLHLKLPRS